MRPRTGGFTSLVLGRCVTGPWSLCPQSSLFPGTCDTIRSAGHFSVPGHLTFCPRSAAVPSQVRTFPRDLRRHTLSRPLFRPWSLDFLSPVLGRCVPGPYFSLGPATSYALQATSPSPVRTFPRDLRHHTLCRPLFRPRSAAVPSPVLTFPWDLRRHTLSRPLSRPRSRPISRTGDSTPPDLQRNSSGPATPQATSTTFPSQVP